VLEEAVQLLFDAIYSAAKVMLDECSWKYDEVARIKSPAVRRIRRLFLQGPDRKIAVNAEPAYPGGPPQLAHASRERAVAAANLLVPVRQAQRRLGERKELLSVPTFQPLTADRLWMLEFGESWTVD
jgi:hypothetical protein